MILYSSWLALSLTTRHKIADQFGIIKTGSTHVVDNQIKDDGFKIQDVENALNLIALQTFLETNETDMQKLFSEVVFRAENPDEVRMEIEVSEFKDSVMSTGDAAVPEEKVLPVKKPRKNAKETTKN